MNRVHVLLVGEEPILTDLVRKKMNRCKSYELYAWSLNAKKRKKNSLPIAAECAILCFNNYDEGVAMLHAFMQELPQIDILGCCHSCNDEEKLRFTQKGMKCTIGLDEIDSLTEHLKLLPKVNKLPLYQMCDKLTLKKEGDTRPHLNSITQKLTNCERQIVEVMWENNDYTAKNIASHLDKSPKTVSNQVPIIYIKLGVKGKLELLRLLKKYSHNGVWWEDR